MLRESMDFISRYDPEVGASIREEFARECRNIELIASENIVSEAVMMTMGTCLTNKYAEGYPGHRYYGGCYAVLSNFPALLPPQAPPRRERTAKYIRPETARPCPDRYP